MRTHDNLTQRKSMFISYAISQSFDNASIANCSLGHLLLARSGKGLCRLSLGDSEAELNSDFIGEYRDAKQNNGDEILSKWLDLITSYLQGRSLSIDLPLDLQATAFQQRVWDQLRTIPYGQTRSYSEIANSLDRPSATRAVARACAANPVALIIPCHRAVRKDGSLGGYRWGLERKRTLLLQEQSNLKSPTLVTGVVNS